MSQRPDCLMRLRHSSNGQHRTAQALDAVGADLRAGLDALARARGRLADVAGELPERLQGLRVGDRIVARDAPPGALVAVDIVMPGKHLALCLRLEDGWYVASVGDSWAPFAFAEPPAPGRDGQVLALGLTALHLQNLPQIAAALRLPHLPPLPAPPKESP